MIDPAAMSTIAVKSYAGINSSPRIYVDKIMFTIIAVAALHASKVKSTNGSTRAWTITLRRINKKPNAHLEEQ